MFLSICSIHFVNIYQSPTYPVSGLRKQKLLDQTRSPFSRNLNPTDKNFIQETQRHKKYQHSSVSSNRRYSESETQKPAWQIIYYPVIIQLSLGSYEGFKDYKKAKYLCGLSVIFGLMGENHTRLCNLVGILASLSMGTCLCFWLPFTVLFYNFLETEVN